MEAKTLRALLAKKGTKQSFIAEHLKVSRSLVTQWVRGNKPIPENHQTELRKLLS